MRVEKPKPPEPRETRVFTAKTVLDSRGEEFFNVLYNEYGFDDKLVINRIVDAEMLIHALAEWIEYKRSLERWEREHTL